MQDVQNIPNPDVNTTIEDNDFGNHSDIEREKEDSDVENIPLPPDAEKPAPVEEPSDKEKPPVGEDDTNPKQLV